MELRLAYSSAVWVNAVFLKFLFIVFTALVANALKEAEIFEIKVYVMSLNLNGLVWKFTQDDLNSECVWLDGFTEDSCGIFAHRNWRVVTDTQWKVKQ